MAICIFIGYERSINSPSAHFIFYDDAYKTLAASPPNPSLQKNPHIHFYYYFLCTAHAAASSWESAARSRCSQNIRCKILLTPARARFTAYPRWFYGVSKWHPAFTGRVYTRCFTAHGASVSRWPLLDHHTSEDVLSYFIFVCLICHIF